MLPELEHILATADWLLDAAERHLSGRNHEEALRCAQMATDILARQNYLLTQTRVENFIRNLGIRVFADPGHTFIPDDGICLHVITKALPSGGHTALAVRWISSDMADRRHDVALVSQDCEAPASLVEAVDARNGRIFSPEHSAPSLHKAQWLRDLVRQTRPAFVVLHIDVNDLTTLLAFSIPGGPPVMYVNHAAHIFWAGAGIADLVLNVRGSLLERYWTETMRGAARTATIPIPLPAQDSTVEEKTRLRQEVREALSIPASAIVILTIGDRYKFAPFGELDFLHSCCQILQRLPKAHMVVIGVVADERWSEACIAMNHRLVALPQQPDVRKFHSAADIYVEGFPFGSTTALLEAGISGLPLVIAPGNCPPPFGSDGIALDHTMLRQQNISEYIDRIVVLAGSPEERAAGSATTEAIRLHHTNPGWTRNLESVIGQLPREHSIHHIAAVEPTPEPSHSYWAAFREVCWQRYTNETPSGALVPALALEILKTGLTPRIPFRLWKSALPLAAARHRRTIPLTMLICSFSIAPRLLPARQAKKFISYVLRLYRDGSLTRRMTERFLPRPFW